MTLQLIFYLRRLLTQKLTNVQDVAIFEKSKLLVVRLHPLHPLPPTSLCGNKLAIHCAVDSNLLLCSHSQLFNSLQQWFPNFF